MGVGGGTMGLGTVVLGTTCTYSVQVGINDRSLASDHGAGTLVATVDRPMDYCQGR